jgi:OOP family OmpA-OmpF porin
MNKRNIAVLLAASALSIPAYAADTGFFLLGSVGQTKMKDLDTSGLPAGTSVDDTDTGFKIGGGYMFHKNIGIEAAYLDLGKATATAPGNASAEAKASGISIVALGSLPVGDKFAILGRLGFINATVKVSGQAPGLGSFSDSSTDMKMTWGIGGQFNFTQNLGVRLDYDSYNKLGDEDKTGESTVDMISLGVVYKF